MDTVKDLLKGANPVVILLLIFLIWQVTNHIPSDIKDLKNDVNRLEDKVDSKISKLEDKISKLEDKIDQILIHLVKESK